VRHGLRVHLGDHQRHALRHAERRAVVHHLSTIARYPSVSHIGK
jgi:hypothetical protein